MDRPTVLDVAAFILRERGATSTIALQKLVYYCQAWSLVWDGDALFADRIEAWSNGPVAPALYQKHRGEPAVTGIPGNPAALTEQQQSNVRTVVKFYGRREPRWLSELTHRERPWLEARGELADGASSNAVISLDTMRAYYASFGTPERELPKSLDLGLELMMSVPREGVSDLLSTDSTSADGVEEWLRTGEGDAWGPSDG